MRIINSCRYKEYPIEEDIISLMRAIKLDVKINDIVITNNQQKLRNKEELGSYYSRDKIIKFNIDTNFNRYNRLDLFFSAIRRYIIGRTLYHEISHHIKNEYDTYPGSDEEEAAEIFGIINSDNYIRKNYKIIYLIIKSYIWIRNIN